jgi:excisionase family DNA binding protein
MSDLLKTSEVAARWRVSPRTVERMAAEGRVDAIRLSPRTLRYHLEAVQAAERRGVGASPLPVGGVSP